MHLRHGDPFDLVIAGLAPTTREVYRNMAGGGACDLRIRCALRTLQRISWWVPIMRPDGFSSWTEELEFRKEINRVALELFLDAEASQ
jgi:hypothetical protein